MSCLCACMCVFVLTDAGPIRRGRRVEAVLALAGLGVATSAFLTLFTSLNNAVSTHRGSAVCAGHARVCVAEAGQVAVRALCAHQFKRIAPLCVAVDELVAASLGVDHACAVIACFPIELAVHTVIV